MCKKRNLNILGKQYYDFDVEKENRIYMYLCGNHSLLKKEKEINLNYRFDTYAQWKDYVESKYKNCSYDMLNEFKHFLNQCLRNTKPDHEMWNIVGTVILTLLVDKTYDLILMIDEIKKKYRCNNWNDNMYNNGNIIYICS